MLQKHFGWLYGSSLRQQHQGGHDRTNYKDGIWWWRSLLLVKSSAAALFVVFFSTFFLCSVFFATRGPDFSLLSAILGASKGNPLKSEIPVLILPPKPLPKSNPLQPENPVHTVPPKPLPKGNPLQQPENPALPLTPKLHPKIEYPLRCNPPQSNTTQTCPTDYYPTKPDLDPNAPPPPACPDYFRWIHEDLKPWKENGITRETLERARRTANFRLVIKNGKVYMQRFQKSFQSRDVFTLWGIIQLLRRYPGQIPDLELMFDCVDWPVILAHHYRTSNVTAPPLFRYCRDSKTLDLVFPDWSFWGWPEINIKPWNTLSKELKEGSKRKSWMEREPYAYWKGNPTVADTRMDLLKCNVSDQQDWHARIYAQDWIKESQQGYKQSDLASQCIHRYKIYIEGSAWSVSEKYILACDSVTLVVKPRYFDFFSRSLMPVEHYWPVKEDDKCKSIKFAVEWGDNHKQKAQAIGRAASKFVHEDLKMDYVYDYMLHMLTEYAKLLKFDPEIPQDAVELCAETMACHTEGLERKFMTESMVMGPADKVPCMMPPPYDRAGLLGLLRRKSNSVRQVEKWERDYWDARTNITDKQSR